MSMSTEVDPEILSLCGYIRVHSVVLGDGQAVSFNLINGWAALTLTSSPLGAQGSALSGSREVIVWALPGTKGSSAWCYNLTLQLSGPDLNVLAMKTRADGHVDRACSEGSLVALEGPTPMEMLASQGQAIANREV